MPGAETAGAYRPPTPVQPSFSEVVKIKQNAERRTTPETRPLARFNLAEGKPIFDSSQEVFNLYKDENIEISKPCPLSHGEDMPLAFEYFVKVNFDNKNAFFRVITKGKPVEFLESNKNDTDALKEFQKINQTMKAKQPERRSIKPTVHWLMQPEEYYSLSADGQREREATVFGKEENSVIVNSVWTERIDTQKVVTPDQFVQDPQFWQGAFKTLNKYFHLQQDEETLTKIPLPFIKEKIKTFQFRGWEVNDENIINTNFPSLGERKLYTLLFMKRNTRGQVTELIRLLSAKPLREKLKKLKPNEYLPTVDGTIISNKERVCSDMWSRKGCECVKQMEKRVATILEEDGVMALLQLDKSMGYGTKVDSFEHFANAAEAGVLGTGKAPADVAKQYKTTFKHREDLFGKKAKKDLTNYRNVARGLFEQMYGKKVTFKVLSDSDNKAGIYPIGPYSAGVKVEKHPIEESDEETRAEKNRFLGNNYNPASRRNAFAQAA